MFYITASSTLLSPNVYDYKQVNVLYINPLSQVVFFHPFPLRRGGGGCINPLP